MSEEELNQYVQKSIENCFKELANNPDEFFDNDKLQKKYNEVIKENQLLKTNWQELKEWLEEHIENANKCLNDPNENWNEDTTGYVLARKFMLEETLNKMQKLENKDVNNK